MNNETPVEPIRLARSLGGGRALALADALLGRRGQALELDGSEVEHVGALSLQVMVAARNLWASDGLPFRIANPSEALQRDLTLLGHPVELLAVEGESE